MLFLFFSCLDFVCLLLFLAIQFLRFFSSIPSKFMLYISNGKFSTNSQNNRPTVIYCRQNSLFIYIEKEQANMESYRQSKKYKRKSNKSAHIKSHPLHRLVNVCVFISIAFSPKWYTLQSKSKSIAIYVIRCDLRWALFAPIIGDNEMLLFCTVNLFLKHNKV